MRDEPNNRLNRYRRWHLTLGISPIGTSWGYFHIRGLDVISSGGADQDGLVWEHVSVSTPNRCPTWEEMCMVKRLFWQDDETVIQFHPPEKKDGQRDRFCLGLWRNASAEVELPPRLIV